MISSIANSEESTLDVPRSYHKCSHFRQWVKKYSVSFLQLPATLYTLYIFTLNVEAVQIRCFMSE
jgi:hypothetical protein